MDVNKTSRYHCVEKLYAEIAKKTAAAIAAEGPPLVANNSNAIQSSLPQLPRFQPPPPIIIPELLYDIRMFFPGSGRMGFDKVKLSDEFPPIEIVREMITYETRLRLSNSIQELMDEYYADGNAVT
jgi:hypothetical protein